MTVQTISDKTYRKQWRYKTVHVTTDELLRKSDGICLLNSAFGEGVVVVLLIWRVSNDKFRCR